MYGSPDGVSQFQYPAMARSLGVILRQRPCFLTGRILRIFGRCSAQAITPPKNTNVRTGAAAWSHPRCDASGATARAASKNGLGAECTETAKTDTAPVLPSFI
jgi:hypothetical protein